jgi:TonB family protein
MKLKLWSVLILMLAIVCAPAMAEGRKVVKEKTPDYPEMARNMALKGIVTLKVTVSPTGRVIDTKVAGGHPLLAQSAVDAVKGWVFEPASDTTVETVKVHFGE